MEKPSLKWLYLFVLALIWGSSFILIKKSLIGLTPLQLGALRVFVAGLFLIGFWSKHLRAIRQRHWKWVILAGFIGTFFPAFCFAYAQTQIDSAITSILNATTPIMTLIFGLLLFKISFSLRQFVGVAIGLVGCLLLIWQSAEVNPHQNYLFVIFIFLATFGYAMNVNILKSKLTDLSPTAITAGSFLAITPAALIVLLFSGFFGRNDLSSPVVLQSVGALVVLAIFSSALALLLFNKLIKMTSAVFSSSVTYLIPTVAIFWGVVDGEKLSFSQLMAMCLIYFGVVLTGIQKRKTA
ncbi:MAG TPA: EamA family transporter [Flavobacteriaceae bacterium]|nr:EamA family transporter [Flavobacteriaceae bacterium]